jgi:hypothetical protein
MGIDWMHCQSLGVFKFWISKVLHLLIDANAMNVFPGPRETVLMATVGVIRTALFDWYRTEIQRGIEHTPVQDFTAGMVGQNESEPLGLHASETNGFLRFTVKLLKDHEDAVEPVLYKCLREGGQALVTLLNLNEKCEEKFNLQTPRTPHPLPSNNT